MARLEKPAALAALALSVAFVVLMAGAFGLYPGGTWEDPRERGASLTRNYFCDLMRPEALNGEPNPGATLASLGLLALTCALWPFFLVAPGTFSERPRLGRWVRVTGSVCGAGGIVMVAVPSHQTGPVGHGLIVLSAAGPGLAAALLCAIGQVNGAARTRRAGLAALATLGFTALTAAVFARQLALGTATTPGLPVLQKLAALSAVAWIGLTAAAVLQAPPKPSPGP